MFIVTRASTVGSMARTIDKSLSWKARPASSGETMMGRRLNKMKDGAWKRGVEREDGKVDREGTL